LTINLQGTAGLVFNNKKNISAIQGKAWKDLMSTPFNMWGPYSCAAKSTKYGDLSEREEDGRF
jgi:hypothetical protein